MLAKLTFNRLFWLTIGVLLLIIGVLYVVTTAAGPRVRYASVDAFPGGSRLVLRFNQQVPVPQKADVRVSPSIDFTVTGNGNTIYVQFKQVLQYDTRYEISFNADGKQLSHVFRTDPAYAYYHYTHADADDEIRKRALNSTQDEVVYRAPKIIDFALVQSGLVVQVERDFGVHGIEYVNLDSGNATTVALEGKGRINHLIASPNRALFGFTYEVAGTQGVEPRLYLGRAADSGSRIEVVSASNKTPLFAKDWRVAPDNRTLLIQAPDSSVVMVDSSTKIVSPIGQYSSIGGFTADGSSLLVVTPEQETGYTNLHTLQFTAIQTPVQGGYITGFDTWRASKGIISVTNSYDGTASRQFVHMIDDTTPQEMYVAKNPETIIIDAYTSGNDYYAFVDTTGDFSLQTNEVRSHVLIAQSGVQVMTLPGKHAQIE